MGILTSPAQCGILIDYQQTLNNAADLRWWEFRPMSNDCAYLEMENGLKCAKHHATA